MEPGDMLRMRAYDIWIAEGCPEGGEKDHWERAAAEIEASESEKTCKFSRREGTRGQRGSTAIEHNLDARRRLTDPANSGPSIIGSGRLREFAAGSSATNFHPGESDVFAN